MNEAVIIDAVRSPVGALGGALAMIRPDDLAAQVIKALMERTCVDVSIIEEVYLGCANQAGEDSRNIARTALLLAGLPVDVAGVTFNRLCASGLTAVSMAARAIRSDEGQAFIAGGVESMSRAPFVLPKAEQPFASGNLTAWDSSMGWRFPNPHLRDTYGTESMGETAENIVQEKGISRERQDAFASESHRRAVSALDEGKFSEEIVPITIPRHKCEPLIFSTDERPRRDTTLENLSKLKPAFRQGGTITAGNSSGLNDGAAVLLVMNRNRAIQMDMNPCARIVATAAAGVLPRVMGLGPVPAVKKALERAGLNIKDISLSEINEAFAVQVLADMDELNLSHEKVNVNGGAIAIGHPLGCSGARILTTLVHEMRRRAPAVRRPFYGMAALCVGVGQGEAMIIEWLD